MQIIMQNFLENCQLCPLKCGTNRWNEKKGSCGAGKHIKAAKAFLHIWEEPCISGEKGSGTIFLSGCNMHCIFCQNYQISQDNFGKEIDISRFSDIMLELQEQGATNINFVSPTPYTLHIISAVELAKKKGLAIPVVYNSNGYETVETIKLLKNTVDIYLPDIKYYSDIYSKKYSKANNYFSYASAAVSEMIKQVGHPVFNEDGIMQKGVLIRHLILPDLLEDSKKILKWIKDTFGSEVFVSLMCQYTPLYHASSFQEINHKLDEWEYDYIINYFFEIGLENGFVQELNAASDDYVPCFDLSGI